MEAQKLKLLIPFKVAVVNDDAYGRMKKQLDEGERYVKTYLTTCPHDDKSKCNCTFNLNFILDGKVVRSDNGKIIPVVSLTTATETSNLFKQLRDEDPEDFPNALSRIQHRFVKT